QPGRQLGELLPGPLEFPGAGIAHLGRVAGCVVDQGVTMAPVGPPRAGRAPGDPVPDEVRDLRAPGVEKADRPGITDLPGLERGPHERIRTVVVGLDQMDYQLAPVLAPGPGGECDRPRRQHEAAGPGEIHRTVSADRLLTRCVSEGIP